MAHRARGEQFFDGGEPMRRIERRLEAAGGIRPLARELGVSASEISRIVSGQREVGDVLAAKLNLRAVTMYVGVPPTGLHRTTSARLPRGRPRKVKP